MSLIPCPECKNQVSTDAKICPQCGANVKKSKILRIIGFLIGVPFIIGIISSSIVGRGNTKEATAPDEKKKPTMNSIAAGCQVEWERTMKRQLHDPSSLDWDHRSTELGTHGKKKTPVVAVPYRAKNSFGAIILSQAICEINPDTGTTIRLIK